MHAKNTNAALRGAQDTRRSAESLASRLTVTEMRTDSLAVQLAAAKARIEFLEQNQKP